jgi:hypothetical protein
MRGRKLALVDPNNPFLQVMSEVLDESFNVVALTDVELLEEINERLRQQGDYKYMMSKSWLEKTKASVLNHNPEELDYYQFEFLRLYKKALRNMKIGLFMSIAGVNRITGEKIEKTDKTWQRIAWIMERKFKDDWGRDKPLDELEKSINEQLLPEELTPTTQKLADKINKIIKETL